MNIVYHPADSRGHANHGWLNAKHSFSFASWYNPERIHFGMLRVLNDDIVAPAMGFGKHPHDNMEIITIVLKGALKHEDSMGFSEVIEEGEVQVMSAGTGIYHSEFNPNKDKDVNLFQIWIFPKLKEVTPRYAQRKYQLQEGQFTQLVGPEHSGIDTWIYQDAWLYMGSYNENTQASYSTQLKGNGIYLMLVEGQIQIADQILNQRDAIGISQMETITMSILEKAKILIIEVPMH